MDWRDFTVMSAGGLLLLLHAWQLFAIVRRQWQFLPGALYGLVGKVRRLCTCQKPPEDIESLVAMAVSKSRLEYFRGYSTAIRVTLATLIMRMCLHRMLGRERMHTSWQDTLVVTFYLQFSITDTCPSLLNTKTMDMWYSLAMLTLTLYCAPFISTAEYFPLATMYSQANASIVSIGCLGSSLVLFWNAVSVAIAWVSTQAFGGDQLGRLFGGRVILTLLTCVFAFLVENRWSEQARRDIEAQLLKETSSAFNALMSRFYDLVTELDSNLVISASGKELSSFLHTETVPSLEGITFAELINCDEQRELFLQRAQQPPTESEGVADMMNVTLRFGTGPMRQVELFTFQFPSIVGRRRFLLGIRDCGEQALFKPEDLPAFSAAENVETLTITVNSALPNLPVLPCSTGLAHLVEVNDTSEGTRGIELADAVSNFQHFEAWLQRVMNMHRSGEPEPAVKRANRHKVRLKLRQKSALGFCYFPMKCSVVFMIEEHTEDDSEDEMDRVQLQFTCCNRPRAQRHALGSNSSKSSSSSGSSGSSRIRLGTPRSPEPHTLGRSVKRL